MRVRAASNFNRSSLLRAAQEAIEDVVPKAEKNQTLNPLSISLNPLQDDPKKTQNPDIKGSSEGRARAEAVGEGGG